jgi:hypothetical protein
MSPSSAATLGIHIVIICCSIRAVRAEHNNQPKEEYLAKMPATEANQQATTSRHDKTPRGRRNTKADNDISNNDRANNFVVGCIWLI